MNADYNNKLVKSLRLQSSDQVEELVTFADSSIGDVTDVDYTQSSIASYDATARTDLKSFLSRPTLIDSRSWSTADNTGILGSTLEPWYLFLNNTVIKNKLSNYAFLRAKLCLKFVINATPFHFGLMRIAYEPNTNAANNGFRISSYRENSNLPGLFVIPASQLPGVWVRPADNSAGELHVPFFLHKNFVSLNSAFEVKSLGTLKFLVAAQLGLATTSGSTTITVDTFAWLEDVELSGSTAALVLQAKDEYDGVISKPASVIASIAGRLESVPVIGKFARATQIGASAIAGVASIFGFTNTPVIDDVHAFAPTVGSHLASSEISGPVQKLSLDPKQELSIDPSMHGIANDDEMIISNLISKESVVTMAAWGTTYTIGQRIWNARVNPNLCYPTNIQDGGGNTKAYRVFHSPLSYVSGLFNHWRGDIIFDIEVVCTKFHKGRLRIAWDPLGQSSAPAENTAYTTILDIGDKNNVSFRVPYHQAKGFLRTRTNYDTSNQSFSSWLTTDPKYDNGLLTISVLTPLISPLSPQDVAVKIMIRAADNFDFANPTDILGGGVPPSFFAVQSKDIIETQPQDLNLGDSGKAHPHRFDMYFGERIVSLRTLLHRYSVVDVSTCAESSATRNIYYVKSFSRLPPSFGYDPSGLSTANKTLVAGTTTFNFTFTHPMTYIAAMFGGFRGSVNYLSNFSHDLYPSLGDVRIVRRNTDTKASFRAGSIASTVNTGTSVDSYRRALTFNSTPGVSGMAITNTLTNGALNWQAPHMLGTNFCYTSPLYSNIGNAYDESDQECTLMELNIKQLASNTTSSAFSMMTAVGSGPDYSLIWFLCCPTIDYYLSIPSAP